MYGYEWDRRTGGYRLTTQTGKFVASEIRPVFGDELRITGLDEQLQFNSMEHRPLLWAKQNVYYYRGKEIARFHKTKYGQPINIEWVANENILTHQVKCEGSKATLKNVSCQKKRKIKVSATDLASMAKINRPIMSALVADTLKRIKEMHEACVAKCDVIYIGFSGGKDSVVLLDLCHRVLPLTVPVVFSDTDMELPDTYKIWEEVQKRYRGRPFIKVAAKNTALDNWRLFGPPSRTVRWCCSVHKSAPALLELKKRLGLTAIKTAAFLGVRGEESLSRSVYEDIGEGVKTSVQTNLLPILDWGAHELWLYLFENDLLINRAYRYGVTRVGCVMCPESSEKYAWFVDAIYPGAIQPYSDTIVQTSSKTFASEEEVRKFLGDSNWQARKSGVALRMHLSRPMEKIEGLTVEWRGTGLNLDAFLEWLKTVGKITIDAGTGHRRLAVHSSEGDGIAFEVEKNTVRFHFHSEGQKKKLSPILRTVLQKAVGCIGCQSCEAECPTGALRTVVNGVKIDSIRCSNCMNCHSGDFGCWRFKSMYLTERSQSTLNGINAYNNFGLREEFLSVYLTEGIAFSDTAKLNKRKQVPAAKAWFRQGLLMDPKTTQPTRLLNLFERRGLKDRQAWDCVWLGLSNYAPIVKWLVCTLQFDTSYSDVELFELLGTDIKEVTKKGGLQALKNMLASTPFGNNSGGVCELHKQQGQRTAITRRAHSVDPLTMLYGLFVMANRAGRNAFTVRAMLSAELEDAFVSPLVAFGISPDEFKKQCMGLAARYPDYLTCSFTLGLDEVVVKTDEKTLDDVVGLLLEQ